MNNNSLLGNNSINLNISGFNDDIIATKEIFSYKQTGILPNGEIEGEFIRHKYIPKVFKILKARGINDLNDIFN